MSAWIQFLKSHGGGAKACSELWQGMSEQDKEAYRPTRGRGSRSQSRKASATSSAASSPVRPPRAQSQKKKQTAATAVDLPPLSDEALKQDYQWFSNFHSWYKRPELELAMLPIVPSKFFPKKTAMANGPRPPYHGAADLHWFTFTSDAIAEIAEKHPKLAAIAHKHRMAVAGREIDGGEGQALWKTHVRQLAADLQKAGVTRRELETLKW
jgi:hypothetical protein